MDANKFKKRLERFSEELGMQGNVPAKPREMESWKLGGRAKPMACRRVCRRPGYDISSIYVVVCRI